MIAKTDLSDFRNRFKNFSIGLVFEENERQQTFENLAEVVCRRLQAWIVQERPTVFEVNGPWKHFLKAVQENNYVVPASLAAATAALT